MLVSVRGDLKYLSVSSYFSLKNYSSPFYFNLQFKRQVEG